MNNLKSESAGDSNTTVAYQRCYRLTVNNQYVFEQTTKKMGFAIYFCVKKNIKSDGKKSSNTMEVKIYNVSQANLQNFTNDQSIVLECGYSDKLGTIFSGTITSIQAADNGRDTITTIQAKENVLASQLDWTKRAFTIRKGSTVKDGVESLCSEIVNVYPSINSFVTEGLPSQPFIRDKHVLEDPFESLYSLLQPFFMTYYVNNGVLYVLPGLGKNQYLTTEVSSKSGMIGQPQKIIDKKKSKKNVKDTSLKVEASGFQVTTLLNPRLEIGDRINLTIDNPVADSAGNLITNYPSLQIVSIVYKGNSYTGQWINVINAEDVPKPQPSGIEVNYNWDKGLLA